MHTYKKKSSAEGDLHVACGNGETTEHILIEQQCVHLEVDTSSWFDCGQ